MFLNPGTKSTLCLAVWEGPGVTEATPQYQEVCRGQDLCLTCLVHWRERYTARKRMTVSGQDQCFRCQYTVDKINLKNNVLYMISVPLTSPISSSISGEIFLLAFPVISMAVFRLAYDILKVLALPVYFSKRVIWYFIRPTCPCSSHINIFTKASLSYTKGGACLPANHWTFLDTTKTTSIFISLLVENV